MAPELIVSLDAPLPTEVAVGRGTALFVAGTAYCPTEEIRSLALRLGGRVHPVTAFGMPRLDFFAELHPALDPFATEGIESDPSSQADPQLRAYRSGFWGIVPIPAGAGPELRIELTAQLAAGATAEATVGTVRDRALGESPAAAPGGHGRDLVAICMATYNPPGELFHHQIESIRAQTHHDWMCVISDDCSSAEGLATIRREVGDDPRFVVSVAPRRQGFLHNFERALSLAPREARWVAMADQDDRWYPDKLSALLGSIGDARLVYSDQRVIARGGEVLAQTYWETRRNNHSDLLSLLVANSVTGAASLMHRDLLDDALPFPPPQFAHFHDHWIALCALATGDITYVDRPLYDYVQHRGASLGHAAATQRKTLRERLRDQRDPHGRVRMWRLHYFVDVSRLLTVETILQLRCDGRISRAKGRRLRAFTASDRSTAAMLAIGLRGLRDLAGTSETLGAEWMLFHAFAWRRLLARSARERPQARLRLDAVPPPSLALKPSRVVERGPVDEIADKIAPLDLAVSPDAPQRINLLIPTMDLQHFFGGYIAKFNLARRLAGRGLRVRLITVDPVGPLPRDYKRQIESYSGLAGLFDEVEVAFGRGPSPLEISREDRFIATTWWTAHIAGAAVRELVHRRFLYLIQEYEPFTFPMGTYAALARQSYEFPHTALFSTELLRDYFRRHGIGAYAGDISEGDRDSLAFQNAITDVRAPTAAELASRQSRRLLFYARPEQHAERNMYDLGLLALTRAAEEGLFDSGWELRGIGTVSGARDIALAGGVRLQLVPRSSQGAYAELLREHDVGLALMYTPHPSLVPIEMAAGGLLTVSNSFENKTPEAMAEISANLIIGPATIDGIVAGLREACAAIGDHDRRLRGSAVTWSRDWTTSFDEDRLDAIVARLGG
jgi:hypothetical protein